MASPPVLQRVPRRQHWLRLTINAELPSCPMCRMPKPSSVVAAEGDLPASPLGDSEDLPELFVNQLVSSELRWRDVGVRLTMEAGEPAGLVPRHFDWPR
jgi:hypothetical protein